MNARLAQFLLGALLLAPLPTGAAPAADARPEHVVSLRQRALSRERYQKLREEWKAWTDAHPRDALGWAQLARVSSYSGVPCDEYVKYAEKAVKLDPDNAEACATLGRYRWGTYCPSQPNDPAEAIRLLEHALKLDPRLDDPHYILWTMRMSQGRPAEANAHLKTLLDNGRMPEPLVDFGYNLLAGLEPDAILFTNGDNDTYPLIALQAVRGVRTDVAVVNLSLLNLEWYRRQLRGGTPAVPVPLLEQSTAAIHSWQQSDEAVKGLLESLRASGWKRPLYAAVTVSSPQDRIRHELSQEGLVYRVLPDTGTTQRVDARRMERNLDEVYRLQSLKSLAVDWEQWSGVRLVMYNYTAVQFRLVRALAEEGRLEEGRKRVEEMLELARFHGQPPARLGEWIHYWASRDPKCPDLARWKEKYVTE